MCVDRILILKYILTPVIPMCQGHQPKFQNKDISILVRGLMATSNNISHLTEAKTEAEIPGIDRQRRCYGHMRLGT